MFIEQLFASQDSCASYFIESDGVAAVIDPDRSVRKYIQLANNREAVIKFIFLTHFQTDFLGGHLELAESTGARIITGPCEGSGFQNECILDGQTFPLGSMTLRAIHTPGHAPEACCYLLYDETMNPHSLFTGDTLLAGDVGRTDLVLPGESTAADMAGKLYDSLFDKIMALPGYLNLFPGNGFASSFMRLSGSSTYSTLGQEKYSNHALKPRSRDEFIEIFSRPEHEPLQYFDRLHIANRRQVTGFEKVLEASLKEIGVEQFAGLARPGQVQILDTRPSQEFCRSFIPGSINIGLDGFFGHIAGMVLSPGTEILLVTEVGREEESVEALARMGFEKISGFLEGGFDSWANAGAATDQILNVSPQEFSEQFRFSHSYALDVRDTAEFVPGFVAGAQLIPLHKLESEYNRLDKEKPCYIYCTAGYRSVVAASMLKAKGFSKLINVTEGMVGIRNTSIPIRQLTAA